MKVFVFGAGASLGSQWYQTNPNMKAPLVNELFDPQYESCGKGILVGNELAECRSAIAKTRNLEGWLTTRWEAADKLSAQARMGERSFFGRVAMYVRESLQCVSASYRWDNGYAQLLRKVKAANEQFGLISFNYDTLLDRAVQDVFGMPLSSLEDYRSFPLIKLHGSVNWMLRRRADDPQIEPEATFDTEARTRRAVYGLFNGAALDIGNLRVLDPRHNDGQKLEYIYKAFDSQYCYPLIFLPLAAKAYGTVSGFENQLMIKAQELLAAADDIFFVGYRAADEVIHQVAANAQKAKLHVVDRDEASAKAIQDAVRQRSQNLKAGTVWKAGYKEFVGAYGT